MLDGLHDSHVLYMRETLVKGAYVSRCAAAIIDVLMDDQIFRDQMLRLLLLFKQFLLRLDPCEGVQVKWLA